MHLSSSAIFLPPLSAIEKYLDLLGTGKRHYLCEETYVMFLNFYRMVSKIGCWVVVHFSLHIITEMYLETYISCLLGFILLSFHDKMLQSMSSYNGKPEKHLVQQWPVATDVLEQASTWDHCWLENEEVDALCLYLGHTSPSSYQIVGMIECSLVCNHLTLLGLFRSIRLSIWREMMLEELVALLYFHCFERDASSSSLEHLSLRRLTISSNNTRASQIRSRKSYIMS